jgi:hypothetical protein
MKWYFIFILVGIGSGHKENASGCDDDTKTVRIVTNAFATISFFENQYFITEQNTIDTILIPCTLPEKFQKYRLSVTISDEVKNYPIKEKILA